MGLDTKTYWLTDWLTDWPSVAMWLWLCCCQLSAVQFSEAMRSSWFVSDRVQLQFSLVKLCEAAGLWVTEFSYSSVQWSDAKQLVCEWQSSVTVQLSWKSDCEEKTRSLVWNGRQPGTHLVELSVDKSSARASVTKGPEREAKESPLC
jgi:hypothetical protein